MSPVPREQFDSIKGEIHAVLGPTVSDLFLKRIDTVLEDWASGKYPAVQACEKVQKMVALFIDEAKAREIGLRFAPIITKETASGNK